MSLYHCFIISALCISGLAALAIFHLRLDQFLRPGWVPAIVVGGFATVALLMIGVLRFDYGDLHMYFAPHAEAVSQGKVPYRDFEMNYGPLFPYLNAFWYVLFGDPRGIVIGLNASYALSILLYYRYRLCDLAGTDRSLLILTLICTPICWFLAGCLGQDENLMALVLCTGCALVGRAHWGWVAVACALGVLLCKLTLLPIVVGLTLATRRPIWCMGVFGLLLLAAYCLLSWNGADLLQGMKVESKWPTTGANLPVLLTLIPDPDIAATVKRSSPPIGAIIASAFYAWCLFRFRDMDPARRASLAEPLSAVFYLLMLLFSHKSLAFYYIAFFVPAACWFVTRGGLESPSPRRLWGCVGFSVLIGLHAPFWEAWIDNYPYYTLWMEPSLRPALVHPATALAVYVISLLIVIGDAVAIRLITRDIRRVVRISCPQGGSTRE